MSHQLDKPVHKVLEDYDLLNVSVIQNSNTINMTSAMLWKMNLCAVSNEIPCTFFVAMNYRIHVYTLDAIHLPFKQPKITLASPNARQTGGGSESPFVINAVKVGRMLDKEILVTVSENGEVCIWKTENLLEPPMIINNEFSTWGIAIHADQGLIAVSANNWTVNVYNIVEMTKDNPIYGKLKNKVSENILGPKSKVELVAHGSNIPNIDFNESGRYLASASIDQTCRVWDITTQEVVTQKKSVNLNEPQHDSWCWSVKFIKSGYFKYAVCIDKAISSAYLQRVYQGRSTSLTNLGLTHSALSPVFPMNVSHVEDLMDEEDELDFSMYNNPNVSENIWGNSLLQEEDEYVEGMYEREQLQDSYNANHGEIEDNSASEEAFSPHDHIHYSDDIMHPELSRSESHDSLQGGIEFRGDMRVRELNEEDEIIEGQSHTLEYEADESSSQAENTQSRWVTEYDIETPEEHLSDVERNNRASSNVWRRSGTFPTQADWSLSIVDDQTAQNRDGWGDEIVTVMRNSSINETEGTNHATVLNRLIQESPRPTGQDENVNSFLSSHNGLNNWSDITEEEYTTAEEEVVEQPKRPSYCIPNVIKRSTSSINQFEEKKKHIKKTDHSLGEYLMISTGKDVIMLSTSIPKMSRIRAEHNMINKVDVRSDQMLSILDRINMVEWLPELELFVAASQKGTVALMRVLQVEFEEGEQACIFNNECYLPTNVFQSTPLYGMTIKKVVSERFTPISYQIFLFYYSGNVLGYTISRKDSDLLIQNLIL